MELRVVIATFGDLRKVYVCQNQEKADSLRETLRYLAWRVEVIIPEDPEMVSELGLD